MSFDAKKVKDSCVKWIRDWFEENGKDCNAIVGISGGKDSATVAALCCEAIGKERVIGVLMPNGIQKDKEDALNVVKHLGISYIDININNIFKSFISNIKDGDNNGINKMDVSEQTIINLPARIRMTMLFAIAQTYNGRVSCNCNLSEDYIGYSTYGGDNFGSFAPLAELTVTEVKQIGHILNLPNNIVCKTPTDGLCGKTDEEKLGFTYEELDTYIREKKIENEKIKQKIDELHQKNLFKINPMPKFVL